SRPCFLKMPPRWPSSATPASQAPRCGIATFNVSCDQAPPPAPTTIASTASVAIKLAFVIVVPPVVALRTRVSAGSDHMHRSPRAHQAISQEGLDRSIIAANMSISASHRPMSRKTKPSPAELIADEFRQEKASALGRLGRALEASLAALAQFDASHPQAASAAGRQLRAKLVAETSVALWH